MKIGRDDGDEEAGQDVCSRVGRELSEGKGGRRNRNREWNGPNVVV